MHAFLVQKGLLKALEGEPKLDIIMTEKDKKLMLEKTRNAIVLSLSDKVLRQVPRRR